MHYIVNRVSSCISLYLSALGGGPPLTMSALFVSEHRRATTTIHIDNQNNGVLA